MKSTLFNMIAVLLCITLVSAIGVGGVYMLTKQPIEDAKSKAVSDAVAAVLPDYNPDTDKSVVDSLEIDKMPINVHTASKADGTVVGYAVETMTKKGFNGVVKLMVGLSVEGEVINIKVIEQSETPGLGTQMSDEGNPLEKSFVGRKLSEMKMSVKKDGDGGEVDALTAATISSRAYTDAVARAYEAYKQITSKNTDADCEASEPCCGGDKENCCGGEMNGCCGCCADGETANCKNQEGGNDEK